MIGGWTIGPVCHFGRCPMSMASTIRSRRADRVAVPEVGVTGRHHLLRASVVAVDGDNGAEPACRHWPLRRREVAVKHARRRRVRRIEPAVRRHRERQLLNRVVRRPRVGIVVALRWISAWEWAGWTLVLNRDRWNPHIDEAHPFCEIDDACARFGLPHIASGETRAETETEDFGASPAPGSGRTTVMRERPSEKSPARRPLVHLGEPGTPDEREIGPVPSDRREIVL